MESPIKLNLLEYYFEEPDFKENHKLLEYLNKNDQSPFKKKTMNYMKRNRNRKQPLVNDIRNINSLELVYKMKS